MVYTLRQYSTVESTAVENAKIKINESSDASVKVENNKEFTIEVTPNAGYAVTEIKVNDTALDNVTFANQTASAILSGRRKSDIFSKRNACKDRICVK